MHAVRVGSIVTSVLQMVVAHHAHLQVFVRSLDRLPVRLEQELTHATMTMHLMEPFVMEEHVKMDSVLNVQVLQSVVMGFGVMEMSCVRAIPVLRVPLLDVQLDRFALKAIKSALTLTLDPVPLIVMMLQNPFKHQKSVQVFSQSLV